MGASNACGKVRGKLRAKPEKIPTGNFYGSWGGCLRSSGWRQGFEEAGGGAGGGPAPSGGHRKSSLELGGRPGGGIERALVPKGPSGVFERPSGSIRRASRARRWGHAGPARTGRWRPRNGVPKVSAGGAPHTARIRARPLGARRTQRRGPDTRPGCGKTRDFPTSSWA